MTLISEGATHAAFVVGSGRTAGEGGGRAAKAAGSLLVPSQSARAGVFCGVALSLHRASLSQALLRERGRSVFHNAWLVIRAVKVSVER